MAVRVVVGVMRFEGEGEVVQAAAFILLVSLSGYLVGGETPRGRQGGMVATCLTAQSPKAWVSVWSGRANEFVNKVCLVRCWNGAVTVALSN